MTTPQSEPERDPRMISEAVHDRRVQIAKLPHWAQSLIVDLDRQRAAAVRLLNEFLDEQTPAAWHWDEWVHDGEQRGPKSKRRYIAADTLTAEWKGVRLRIGLRDGGIELQWEDMGGSMRHKIGLHPRAFQQVDIHGIAP